MKKKDIIEMYITSKDENILNIRIIPNLTNKITNSQIQIHLNQNIMINSPQGYNKSLLIETNDFQKM